MIYRHNCELHFIRNVQLALLQDFTEMKKHPGVAIHTLDEAKSITHGSNHPLEDRK